MCYLHAARASELCNLTLSDIASGYLTLARLKRSVTTVQAIERHRGVPILDEQKALREWLAIRPTDCGEALFTSTKSGRLTRSQVWRLFKKYAIEIGLPEHRQNPHLLKHSLCSHLVKQGVHLARVQVAAGHRSVTSTMKYVHLTDRDGDTARHNALMNVDWGQAFAAKAGL